MGILGTFRNLCIIFTPYFEILIPERDLHGLLDIPDEDIWVFKADGKPGADAGLIESITAEEIGIAIGAAEGADGNEMLEPAAKVWLHAEQCDEAADAGIADVQSGRFQRFGDEPGGPGMAFHTETQRFQPFRDVVCRPWVGNVAPAGYDPHDGFHARYGRWDFLFVEPGHGRCQSDAASKGIALAGDEFGI